MPGAGLPYQLTEPCARRGSCCGARPERQVAAEHPRLLAIAFGELGLHRVRAILDPRNDASEGPVV
jgi:hypothetical protein